MIPGRGAAAPVQGLAEHQAVAAATCPTSPPTAPRRCETFSAYGCPAAMCIHRGLDMDPANRTDITDPVLEKNRTDIATQVELVLRLGMATPGRPDQRLVAGGEQPGWWPGHDRGRVLVDLAVMIADGGEAICDIDVLRHQGELFGFRALDEVGGVKERLGRRQPAQRPS